MNTSIFNDDLLGPPRQGKGVGSRNPFEKERSTNPFAHSFDNDEEESRRYYNSSFFSTGLSADLHGNKPDARRQKTAEGKGKKAYFAKLFAGRANKRANIKDNEVELSESESASELEWEDERAESRRKSERRYNTALPDNTSDEPKDDNEEEHVDWNGPCTKLFFIWMYITATIYGSIGLVSAVLLLLAFRYVQWFESERERDLFQLACLGFCIMFSLIVTSMWISFKEKQYCWAFVASLPSVAVFSAAIIIFQSGDIGAPPTTAPIDYYDYDMNGGMEYYDANGQEYGYEQGNGGG